MSLTFSRGADHCQYGGGCVPFAVVRNSGQSEVETTMTPRWCGQLPPAVLRRGDVLQERYPWDQQPLTADATETTGQEVARGVYTIQADWHSLGQSKPVVIQLVA
jgi:hypothetical protein